MGTLFALEAIYAGKGDAMILHHGTEKKPRWILIDGGHHHVYTEWLAPRLRELRSANHEHWNEQGRLPFDMVMVSHADADHVKGLLELFRHMDTGGTTREHPAIAVDEMWFNAFDELLAADGAGQAAVQSTLRAAAANDGPLALPESARKSHEIAAVIASTKQGVELRDLARKLIIPLNQSFNGGLIRRDGQVESKGLKPIRGRSGFTMTVLGPDQTRIDKARARWAKDLQPKADAGAELTSFSDDSPHNLASIMVLVEQSRKSMLLTGDGRGDHLEEGLKAQGLLNDKGAIHVDLFKLPHHGSDNNTKQETFEKITADHYLISANGEHSNPMVETLEMLEEGRKAAKLDTPYSVYFTFPESAFELLTEKELAKSPTARTRHAALKKLDDWTRSDRRPDNCRFVYRPHHDLGVTIALSGNV